MFLTLGTKMIEILQNDNVIDNMQIINEIDSVRHLVDVSNSTVANGLSTINTILVAATIVIGIVGVVGILLGIYVSHKTTKVSDMLAKIKEKENDIAALKNKIEEKETKVISLAKKIEDINDKIQSDISGLYQKLRKEETRTLLQRLEEEPFDINNLFYSLATRQLDEEFFPILKKAFIKFWTSNDNEIKSKSIGNYINVLFQEYLYKTVLDNEIRPNIVNYQFFKMFMKCAFSRDMIKSTNDFCSALSHPNTSFDKVTLLADYLKALNESKYKYSPDLKKIFQENVDSSILFDAIKKCEADEINLAMFKEV